MFSRENRRPKTAKVKYILGLGLPLCCFHPLLWWLWWCPLVAGGALLLPLFGCVPSLCPSFVPFLLCLWYIAFEYGFISRFKGVFGAFWGADVCLYRLRSLLGLCGFCAREVFGGLKACGEFASILSLSPMFYLFCIRFSSSSPIFEGFAFVILGLSSCLPCLFLCHCGVCVFFFPYGICAKRKGAIPCVLSCPVVCLLYSCVVIEELRCRCFGFFQFVRFILPANTT